MADDGGCLDLGVAIEPELGHLAGQDLLDAVDEVHTNIITRDLEALTCPNYKLELVASLDLQISPNLHLDAEMRNLP